MPPTLADGGLINIECAEMVLSESLARRSAGAEGFARLLRRKTTQVGMLENFLRNAGNIAPIAQSFRNAGGLAEGTVRRVVLKMESMQTQEQRTKILIPVAFDQAADVMLHGIDRSGFHPLILPPDGPRQTTF